MVSPRHICLAGAFLALLPLAAAAQSTIRWQKAGASQEDFQRARARCLAAASSHADMTDTRWTMIFLGCMRGDGWTIQR